MKITNAKYQTSISSNKNVSIGVTIDGETMSVPLDPDNRHYEEILRQVAAGDLTIADAD
jgi:hypothetical protein